MACSYVSADGRRLCGNCDLEEDAPMQLKSIVRFLDDSELYDALDYLHSNGNHSIEKMSERRMPNTMRYIIIEWHRMSSAKAEDKKNRKEEDPSTIKRFRAAINKNDNNNDNAGIWQYLAFLIQSKHFAGRLARTLHCYRARWFCCF